MSHSIEWSQAYTGRLTPDATAPFAARASELAQRLQRECAAGTLPFLTFPFVPALRKSLPPLLPRIRSRKHMLVLGIGGSALGARAIQRAFAPGQDGPGYDGPCLWIADNVSPTIFESWLSSLSPSDTTVVCISKSGGTIETVTQYFLARRWLREALGSRWTDHMIVVTDIAKGFLRQEAQQHGLDSLEVPDHLGGRYSALSAVGLLPAAFLGIDWEALLNGAADVARPLADGNTPLESHPAFRLACWANALEAAGYSQLIFFCYIPLWATYGPWFAQLWAESLGKEGKGLQPVPAVGVTDQHSVNQMFLDGQRDKGCIFVTCADDGPGRNLPDDLPENWAWLRGKPFGDLLTAEALGNLVDNAVKYTPSGGRVTLSAALTESFCRVDVADTGPGIPESEQGAVFNRFARGSAARGVEGLGIGLYLARQIAAGQGGYIRVRSAPGQGSVFSLYLPLRFAKGATVA